MGAGAPKDNKNAEKWTIEDAEKHFNEAIELAEQTMDKDQNKEFDFVGEVAVEQGVGRSVYDYLVEKFPSLDSRYKTLKSICEANCFRNGKKGNIVPSLAIMNLKSNHGWTDRVDHQSKGEQINPNPTINLTLNKSDIPLGEDESE